MIEQLLQADRLLVVDQVEQARQTYARVAELDPNNAIAVVGLARCALADGDDHAAYDLAAKALRIDPENDMARRMEARLAEVLEARGEPVARSVGAVSTLSAARGPTEPVPVAPSPASVASSRAPVASSRAPVASAPSPASAVAPADVHATRRRSLLDRLRGR